jgi:hypothetical protein
VQAGADPDNPSVGVLGIFRQDFVAVRQTRRVVRVPGTGPLRIVDAPRGDGVKRLAQRQGKIEFRGRDGTTGSLDLEDESISQE